MNDVVFSHTKGLKTSSPLSLEGGSIFLSHYIVDDQVITSICRVSTETGHLGN